jgi:hypothetical protein
MSNDLSLHHGLISKLFTLPQSDEERDRHRLSTEQVEFFHEFGYLKGIRVLDESQVEALSNELQELVSPQHPRHELFYEFHSNESHDPSRVLFHALGAWRIMPGFHDLLWNPAFTHVVGL